MARTHKTAHIKQQMAEKARQEEATRLGAAAAGANAEEVERGGAAAEERARLQTVPKPRTRSERAAALQRAREEREKSSAMQFGPHAMRGGASSPDTVEDEDEEDAEGEEDDDEDAEEEEEGEEDMEEDAEDDEGAEEGNAEEGDAGEDDVECGIGEIDAKEEEQKNGASEDTIGEPPLRQRKKRSVEEVDEDLLIPVPPFQQQHNAWAEFEQGLKQCMTETRQLLVVKEVINVARHNATLRKQIQNQEVSDGDIPLVPMGMEAYQRKYICTHGWPACEISSGKRTMHKLRRTVCPFQMLAQVAQKGDGSWEIALKRERYIHNHQVSPNIYQHYPGIRQVSSHSALVPGVQLLMQAQAGASSIYEYIRESSDHHVTMKNVHNLVSRLRNSGVQLSDDDAVAETIANFNMASAKNVASFHQSALGNTGVISITTGDMRSMVDSFPEVLQMDCTHKSNKYNYQLLSMVAMDQFGHGQPVQYSLLETNADCQMAKCLEHFKRLNEHCCLVRIVIMDKDMREVEVIRQKLPEARILFCHFHVIKWLQETIRKSSKYGAYYEAGVLTQLKHSITNMTYSRTEADYEAHRVEFKSLSLRGGRHELWKYFEKNWDECKDMWVMVFRVDLPHFNNHTNNRVESLFGKVKQHLKGHLSMNSSSCQIRAEMTTTFFNPTFKRLNMDLI